MVTIESLNHTQVLANKPGDFLVLCHGDPWSNNIMFDYDEETAQVSRR